MKYLRQLCAAFVLIIILALSAFAGEMSTTVVSPPPPSMPATTAGGEMTTVDTGEISTINSVMAPSSAIEIAVNLVQGVLSLF